MDIPAKENENRQFRLPDGRRLGFAEYGDPNGLPLILFHGTPGSRLMFRFADQAALRSGLRLIAPDRPGIGLSDRLPERTIPGWCGDVARLADHLKLEQFGVAGISGGGPYALACAHGLADRLTYVGVISGFGPLADAEAHAALKWRYRFLFALAGIGGITLWISVRVLGLLFRIAPAAVFRWAMASEINGGGGPKIDADVFRTFVDAALEAMRDGPDGIGDDLHLMARPWGFDLGQISVPLEIWHGGEDRVVPFEMGLYIAAAVPGCQFHAIEEEGHFLGATRISEILRRYESAPR
ncbi:MAG: alpha/beta hydrolase [Rhodospirillales bacterium]|nr:alpha/beta hydrolase [Rhodospirillaceae bacterium]MDP6427688.1 alpha/beta hydrolase [Rhodospirillales bacterium]MDP6645472.1 alpha/beta hydrolase [Rhodospirillales bacterium]MDP6843772.1 alpha/beta hydrolase [Rhodospirillales bacterium]